MNNYDWKNYTVLIAEDDAMSYKFLELVLTKRTNINIIWAINGKQAVEYCLIYDYINLILMDLQLPVMSGFDAIKQIKQHNPNIPIIVQSANSYNGEQESCMKLGCDGYIVKPINSELLIEQIEGLLKPISSRTI
jgi:CheY-like chemotaxis protein